MADGKNNWSPSEDILDYIMSTESFRPNVYKDGNGIKTIGYGFTDPKLIKKYDKKGASMSKKEAKDIFRNKLVPEFTKYLISATENFDELSNDQKDALFSYIYNIGYGSYTRKNPDMHKALADKDWEAVAQNMDFGYNDDNNRGLRKRRDYERKLFGFLSDEDGNVYPIGEKTKDNSPSGIPSDGSMIVDAAMKSKNILELQDPLSTSRGEAFREARKRGDKIFEWNGRKYSTDVKKDGGVIHRFDYGGTTRDEAEDYIFGYLTSNGFGKPQAVAIIANLIGESGLRHDITRKGGSDFGLQQWIGPRKKALYEYAKEMGHDEPTFDDQLEFLVKEYKGEIPGSGWNFQSIGKNLHKDNPEKFGEEWDYYQYGRNEFENADSATNATVMYNQGFGRAYKENLRNDFRIKQAQRLAEKFGLDQGVSEMTNQGESGIAMEAKQAGNIPLAESFTQDTGEDKFEKWFEDYGRDFVRGINYERIGEEVSSSLYPLISSMGSKSKEDNSDVEPNITLDKNLILDSMINEALSALNYSVKGVSKNRVG